MSIVHWFETLFDMGNHVHHTNWQHVLSFKTLLAFKFTYDTVTFDTSTYWLHEYDDKVKKFDTPTK